MDKWQVELVRPKVTPSQVLRTTQTFTSVDTGATSLTSPGIIRAERSSVVRGINPWGCQTEVKLLRHEATRNEACLN